MSKAVRVSAVREAEFRQTTSLAKGSQPGCTVALANPKLVTDSRSS